MNLTVSKIPPRPMNGGEYMRICQAPGCLHHASWQVDIFHGYRDLLCGGCKDEWLDAYVAAFSNWDAVALDGGDGDQPYEVAA